MVRTHCALETIHDWAHARDLTFHHDPATRNGAVFSRCGTWRYLLWRGLAPRRRVLGIGMLNPSTADHRADDPTIARCLGRAAQAEFPALLVWNLFAFRATLPSDLKAAADPVGPDNDAAIGLALDLSRRTIVAWGVHGRHRGRDREVLAQCGSVQVLGLTVDGHPRHPLYVASEVTPRRWLIPPLNFPVAPA